MQFKLAARIAIEYDVMFESMMSTLVPSAKTRATLTSIINEYKRAIGGMLNSRYLKAVQEAEAKKAAEAAAEEEEAEAKANLNATAGGCCSCISHPCHHGTPNVICGTGAGAGPSRGCPSLLAHSPTCDCHDCHSE
jgi:hypothetical protein